MRKEPPQTLNMDSLQTKRRLMAKIATLRGLYEVSIRKRKLTRSLNQNAYYFAAFVHPFAEWLTEEWGETISVEQAHIQLKIAVLGMRTKIDKETGEVMELVPTTRFKDTGEFSEYLEKAAEVLARVAGIVVLPSEMFFEEKEKARKRAS